ncbi:Cullin [Trachipleistophora hominis]|uniref:Nuclear pore protein n=1 Tax=Trachipleistophora hominis TaxID=72359 RepID=L7JSE2_TRAHO|nr:Cullin [Trachipleistophora hominis]
MAKNKFVPLVLQPIKIENYALLITKLKMMSNKYKNCCRSTKFIDEVFSLGDINLKKCLLRKKSVKEEKIDLREIINGYFEHTVRMKNDILLKDGVRRAKAHISNLVKKLKEEDKMKKGILHKIQVRDSMYIEVNFDRSARVDFSNPFLKYAFDFFTQHVEIDETYKRKEVFSKEINFLEKSYYDHVQKVLLENNKDNSVEDYVKIKYPKEEYFIESYDGRYLFAEVYTYVRCGFVQKALELIDTFSVFFEQMAPSLRESIVAFFNNNYVNKLEFEKARSIKNDRFKLMLYQLVCNVEEAENLLENFEDFLWFRMLQARSVNDILMLNKSLDVDGCKLLVLIFCKKYGTAMRVLYAGDFSIIEIFYVMRELCKVKKDISLYAEIVFTLLKGFKSLDRKLKLVNSLHAFNDYESLVAEMIVKYEAYDLLGLKSEVCYLDKTVVDRVAAILSKRNDRTRLLQLYYLFNDDVNIVGILNEYLIDHILRGKKELFNYTEIIAFYSQRSKSRETEKMKILKGLADFKDKKDIAALRNSGIFTDAQPSLLMEIKPVIEKLVPLIVSVIEEKKESVMAKELFELCSSISLGERCTVYVGEKLVLLL